MDTIILIIIGLLSGYYIYRKLFKCTNGKTMCKSCGMCNFCHVPGNNREEVINKNE